MCVFAGNFSQILFAVASVKLNSMGISNQDLKNFVVQSILNVENNPKANLTGPIIRKDQKTISNNISALDTFEQKEVYKSFVELYEHTNF